MAWITHCRLTHFRNIEDLHLSDLHKINCIDGENGIGKTNILDGLLRLTAVLGLKMQPALMCETAHAKGRGWQVEVCLKEEQNPIHTQSLCRVGILPQSGQKFLRYLGEKTNHAHLNQMMPCLWTHPVHDKLFTENMAAIRAYFYQMIGLIFPEILTHMTAYDKGCKQRLKLLLSESSCDAGWMLALEQEIAENAIAIIQARRQFLTVFKNHQSQKQQDFEGYLPLFSLDFTCDTSDFQNPEEYRQKLQEMRSLDSQAKKTLFGVHRMRWQVMHLEKKMGIDFCSTGEQKAILLSVLFMMNHILMNKQSTPPILLLDDVLAHFDKRKIDFLYDYLHKIPNQSFLTGTDFAFCEKYAIKRIPITKEMIACSVQPVLFR